MRHREDRWPACARALTPSSPRALSATTRLRNPASSRQPAQAARGGTAGQPVPAGVVHRQMEAVQRCDTRPALALVQPALGAEVQAVDETTATRSIPVTHVKGHLGLPLLAEGVEQALLL